MGAQPCDSLMSMVLADPRVPRQLPLLTTTMQEKREWLEDLDMSVWDRLASLVAADTEGHLIRQEALRVAAVSLAWFDQKVLEVARGMPWKYVHGDLEHNARLIKQLSVADAAPDEATSRLRRLMVNGVQTPVEIAQALFLLGEVPWTTLDCEQSHGSIALMHRWHRDLGPEHLSIRAFIHSARAKFQPEELQRKIARLEQELDATFSRNPNMLRGQNVFVSKHLRPCPLNLWC